MSNHQTYQSFVDKYKGGEQFVKKLGTSGLMLQAGIIGFINGWKHLEIGYYKIAAPILFSLSLYFFVKDLITSRKIEENLAQIILDGVDLEKNNSTTGKFFHGLLQSFNFTNILVQRSLINVVALGCLGYLIFQFINDIMLPQVTISRWFLAFFIWIPGVVVCKVYYDSLKILDVAKEKVFAK